MNLLGLAGGLIAVRVGYPRAIPVGEGNNLGFALLVVRATWIALEVSCFAAVKARPVFDDSSICALAASTSALRILP